VNFQLYNNPGNGLDAIHPERDAYTISVHLDDGLRCADKTFEEKYQGDSSRCCDE